MRIRLDRVDLVVQLLDRTPGRVTQDVGERERLPVDVDLDRQADVDLVEDDLTATQVSIRLNAGIRGDRAGDAVDHERREVARGSVRAQGRPR